MSTRRSGESAPATLRSLLHASEFDLRRRTEIDDAHLDAPLEWAHSSDLPDPTPWVGSGGLLLTDGVQFIDRTDADTADAYVARLVRRGVRALGFAISIVHDSIPDALVDACTAQGLPLIEVSARTPFMGIIRFVSDALASQQRERLERSLTALRSIARAALRPDGLAGILRELERNLDCGVALFDASGTLVPVPTLHPAPLGRHGELERVVRATLARGRTAAIRVGVPDVGEVTLQTLGRADRLRGVLAVGTGVALNRADSDLIESVIALASIALEQSSALDTARRRLRAGILELLASGSTDAAGRTVQHLWGALPAAPVRVGCVVLADSSRADPLIAAFEAMSDEGAGKVFFAERDGHVYVIVPQGDRAQVDGILRMHDARAGFSAPASWADLPSALVEARRAAERTTEATPFLDLDGLADAGLLWHLEQTGAAALAARLLQPLDVERGVDLRETLRVWLSHNGTWDPAARVLGIHRHTLRSRIETAGRLLGRDFETFGARAEVWQALELVRA
ncbi:PucR family transcriptional regulator [Microbacterium sp. cx-55]|uniref:PucR family transcriptional regulator n=1 Tax=Microbacterium sp. cx-55 TaxID=2875948 RepID=UPI001CBDFD63|nr:PucR family transcriptional regulator [Microbacterium sp. cx-55]MBZ4487529.1 PucR family transcriptional regulator [Microbacterium sp. cx-55]UGB35549.1 PucR family transcriptional regulator [Microbacterium sp. cx-55]